MRFSIIDIPHLFKLPGRILARLNISISRYIIIAASITSIPVVAVTSAAVFLGYIHFELRSLVHAWPIHSYPIISLAMGLADMIILSPLLESGLALIPIWIFRKMRFPDAIIPIVAGLIWGVLHCRGTSWISMIQAWPFYCFTIILMTHEKPSLDRAWIITSIVHSVHNVVGLFVSAALTFMS